MRFFTIGIVLALLVTACKTTEESFKETGKKPLTSAQIEKLYSGKTATGTSNSSGRPFQVTYNPDGSATLNSGSFSDSGKWWVEGKDTYCSQWTKVRDGAKRCLRIYDLGDKYQSVDSDGYASATFTIK